MLHDILSGLLPVFFGLGLGYFAGKCGLVDNQNLSTLNTLLVKIALPLTLFVSLAGTSEATLHEHIKVVVVLLLTMPPMFVLAYLVQVKLRHATIGEAAIQAQVVASSNFSAVGLTLLMLLFGQEGALLVAVAITISQMTTAPLTRALLRLYVTQEKEKRGEVAVSSPVRDFVGSLKTSVTEPLFLGPFLGLCFALLGLSLPEMAKAAMQPMVSTTGGIGLFLTGLLLSAQRLSITPNVCLSTLANIGLLPLWAFAVSNLLQFPPHVTVYCVFLMALPTGYVSIVYGAGLGVKPLAPSSTLVLTTIGSIISLSLAIAWMHGQKGALF
ncbi:MAG: AEC family transporter [Xanthobacter sp.]